MKTMRPNP